MTLTFRDGEDVEIIKHECVSHVQKRMGTAPQKLKKSCIEEKNGHLVKFTDSAITAHNVLWGCHPKQQR